MNAIADPRPTGWAITLVTDAAAGCPALFLLSAAGLLALILAAVRFRAPHLTWILTALLAGMAWGLRDRFQFLADSRLWIHTAEVLGDRVPLYRAPLAAKILGWAGSAAGTGHASLLLAAISVGAGMLVVLALVWGLRASPEDERLGPLLPVLVFGAPMGFLFFGHVETTPLFAAAMALFLASLRRDFHARRPGLLTGVFFVVLGFTHLFGLLILVPLSLCLWPASGRARVTAAAGLILIAAALLAAVPPLRPHTIWAQSWTAKALMTYLTDVVNGWALLAVPGALLAWRTRAWRDPWGRFLLLTVSIYALLPFALVLELGVYRDLDLFAPAFVALIFLAAHGIARFGFPPRRFLAGTCGAGAILLASILTLGRCPAGREAMANQLHRGAMTENGRSYGWEILAFAAWEEGRLDEAEARLRTAIGITPGNHRLYGPLGEIQLARGDTAAAISSLTLALATPRSAKTAPLLVEVLTRAGRPREALGILESRRESLLADSRGAAALAVAYFRAGLPESTLAVARARLGLDPADDVAYVNVAAALGTLGRYEKAVEALRQSVRLAPRSVDHHRRLVRALLLLPGGEDLARDHLSGLGEAMADSVLHGLSGVP